MFSDPRRADVVVAQSLWAHVLGPVAKDRYRAVERPTPHAVGLRALALALMRSRVKVLRAPQSRCGGFQTAERPSSDAEPTGGPSQFGDPRLVCE